MKPIRRVQCRNTFLLYLYNKQNNTKKEMCCSNLLFSSQWLLFNSSIVLKMFLRIYSISLIIIDTLIQAFDRYGVAIIQEHSASGRPLVNPAS